MLETNIICATCCLISNNKIQPTSSQNNLQTSASNETFYLVQAILMGAD
jgi:hypothetical protein